MISSSSFSFNRASPGGTNAVAVDCIARFDQNTSFQTLAHAWHKAVADECWSICFAEGGMNNIHQLVVCVKLYKVDCSIA
jgi:hypothetical protein